MLRPILLVAVLAAGQAQASSILVLEGREEASSPSITAVPALQPEGAAGEPAVAAGPSIVAPEAAVAPEETTAAVGEKPPRRADTLVIRGGIYGGAFTQAAPQAPDDDAPDDDAPDDGVPDDDDPGAPPAGPVTVPE